MLNGMKVSGSKVVAGWGGIPGPYRKSANAYNQNTAAFQTWRNALPPKLFSRNPKLPLRSLQEVEGLQISLRNFLDAEQSCAIASTMGGAGPIDADDFLDPDREVMGCASYYKGVLQDAPHLGEALENLRDVNPAAHAWVVDRIFAKAVNKNTSLTKNVDQEVANFYKKLAKYTAFAVTPLLIGLGVFLAWKYLPRGAK